MVLCIQDGTDLNFATRAQCDDLGVDNQTSAKTAGLHLHTTMAVDGLPLLKLEFDAPMPGKNKPPEECKSGLRGLRECAEAARRLDGTQLVSVREADFMFAEQRRLGNHCGARQAQQETVENGETVRQRPRRAGSGPSETCGLSQRPKVSKRKAGRKERVADMEIRYRNVLLPPSAGGTAPLSVQVVHMSEPEPPEGAKPVVPAVAVSSVEDAMRVVGWYVVAY